MTSAAGLVLAAGAGTRFGGPKALARDERGVPWVQRAAEALRNGGCDPVLVALGAGAADARALVPTWATVVAVDDWRLGVSASLRRGLEAAQSAGADAVIVIPVDTPGLPAAAVARMGACRAPLAQAVYGGVAGHPVRISHEHFLPLGAAVAGDVGARPYLVAHGVVEIESADLWSGADVDDLSSTPER